MAEFKEGSVEFNGDFITFVETYYTGKDRIDAVEKNKLTAIRLSEIVEVTFYEKTKTSLIVGQGTTVFDYDYIIIKTKNNTYSVKMDKDEFLKIVDSIS